MRQAAYLSGYGRGAFGVVAAACLGLTLAGCSSGVSRFDFPAFNLTGNDTAANGGNADLSSTSSLPPVLPEESVYSSGEGTPPRLTRANLPPPDYSPRPDGLLARAERARRRAHGQLCGAACAAAGACRAAPKVQGVHVKVGKGDTLSTLSRRYGVPVEKIMAANDLPDERLSIGQELIIPGAKEPKVVAEAAPAETAPPAPGQASYKVEKGDTPHSIADKFGVSEKALIERNKINPSSLRIGQVLVVPEQERQAGGRRQGRRRAPRGTCGGHRAERAQGQDHDHPRAGDVAGRRGSRPGHARREISRQDARQRGGRHSRFARGHRRRAASASPATNSCRRPSRCPATASAGR